MTSSRLLMVLLLAVAAMPALAKSSYADPCTALRSQMLSAGRGGASPELAQLRRQLAAIRGIERQRHCTAASAVGGFFNACADLARNRTEVERRIAGSGNSSGDLQARYVSLGCQSAPRQQPAAKRPMLDSNAMLFCVRLSDGYFFPAPNSQFAQGGDPKDTVDRCRYICDDPGVDLYTLSDPSLETDQMVAVETRKPYADLPTAFRYRDDAEFKACDLKRYSQRVAELRARTVTPANMENAVIPLPAARPDLGIVSYIPGAETAGMHTVTAASGGQASAGPAAARTMRVVGPAFFPGD
ncbi:DUF2865 domain-containing protein [Mesorhizobium sp. ORM8.1]